MLFTVVSFAAALAMIMGVLVVARNVILGAEGRGELGPGDSQNFLRMANIACGLFAVFATVSCFWQLLAPAKASRTAQVVAEKSVSTEAAKKSAEPAAKK